MKILAANIISAYLMVDTKELMCTRLGPEFGEWTDKLAIFEKTLNGLIGSCAQFYCHLCTEFEKIGFKPSKANPDLWMRGTGVH
eukprot:2913751-Ditylum_brightwellii.AAC.1